MDSETGRMEVEVRQIQDYFRARTYRKQQEGRKGTVKAVNLCGCVPHECARACAGGERCSRRWRRGSCWESPSGRSIPAAKASHQRGPLVPKQTQVSRFGWGNTHEGPFLSSQENASTVQASDFSSYDERHALIVCGTSASAL